MNLRPLRIAKIRCFQSNVGFFDDWVKKNINQNSFSNFSCMFLNPNIFSILHYDCSNLLDLRNLQEQVKKAFYYQKLFWPFTAPFDREKLLKIESEGQEFVKFLRSLEQFFLTLAQTNFDDEIPFLFMLIPNFWFTKEFVKTVYKRYLQQSIQLQWLFEKVWRL